MASKSAAARAAAAVAARSSAARHVASDIRRFAPLSPRRGFFGDTAAWTRPLLPFAPSGPSIHRRGLAMIPGDHSPGPEDFTLDSFDPYAPDDPATCFAYDEKDLESEETMWALYERWRSFYNVKRDHDDMVRRFRYFKDRARRIHEFNKSGMSYTCGLQIFGDVTPEEVSEFLRPKSFPRT